MGIYSHLTDTQLTELRGQLVASLTSRLTGPTSASSNGRSVAYAQQTTSIKREIEEVNTEIASRQGQALRRPIYIV
jgi:hypothetical protein